VTESFPAHNIKNISIWHSPKDRAKTTALLLEDHVSKNSSIKMLEIKSEDFLDCDSYKLSYNIDKLPGEFVLRISCFREDLVKSIILDFFSKIGYYVEESKIEKNEMVIYVFYGWNNPFMEYQSESSDLHFFVLGNSLCRYLFFLLSRKKT